MNTYNKRENQLQDRSLLRFVLLAIDVSICWSSLHMAYDSSWCIHLIDKLSFHILRQWDFDHYGTFHIKPFVRLRFHHFSHLKSKQIHISDMQFNKNSQFHWKNRASHNFKENTHTFNWFYCIDCFFFIQFTDHIIITWIANFNNENFFLMILLESSQCFVLPGYCVVWFRK